MKHPIEANQAIHLPIDDLALIETHMRLIETINQWTDIGILIDENGNSMLILMLQGNSIVSLLRFCLSVGDSMRAIEILRKSKGKILFGGIQGVELTNVLIGSIESINDIWNNIPDQIIEFSLKELNSFFQQLEDDSKKSGRGKDFSTQTKRKVMQDSHGRCMFEGCGEDLGFDDLSGIEGNFSYLAHNVASSENGPRGITVLSGKLSDDPKNILLLCDKHHRLIDKIAAPDYPASRLSEMRREFCTTAKKLLDGLSYQPIPVFSVLWPVHRQVIAAPSASQVANCLATFKSRLQSNINDVSDNEPVLRESDPALAKEVMVHSINSVAERILMQAQNYRYRAALFAFGLMPHLIALGAKLGNKNEIIPIPRFRDSGQWAWPSEVPTGFFYTISGIEDLSDNEPDVILILALTNEPEPMFNACDDIRKDTHVKLVSIKALPHMMGNGALAHPEDGYAFMKDIQKLLHDLKSKHGVTNVHLLPCAPNAACVFFGQAFDSHHPDIVVYDFHKNTMQQELVISNKDNKCIINSIS